jgi:hypothetical protein
LALALGRFRAACFAFGRFAAFFGFFAAGFRFGALIGSSAIGPGVGAGAGGGGYVGSIMPEPVQLLSEKSFDLSIGSLLCSLCVEVAYSLRCECGHAREHAATAGGAVRRPDAARRGGGAAAHLVALAQVRPRSGG